MMVGCEVVKSDLKRLKRLVHCIEARLQYIERQEKRLEQIGKLPFDTERERARRIAERNIEQMCPSALIVEELTIEGRYMAAIFSLPPLEARIIVELYINDKTQEEVAKLIYYSKDTVARKSEKAIEKIAKIVNC